MLPRPDRAWAPKDGGVAGSRAGPNRYVEPNFSRFSIETKDGETYDGIIGRENRSSVVLRNASGDVEVKAENIKSRRNRPVADAEWIRGARRRGACAICWIHLRR